jgi:tricorn protease
MPSGYYRFPTIHADTVVFVSEDDLWIVPAGGGIARRLTSNLGEVSRPWFSPDGEQLAFVGREEGQADVYVMPALGGPAQRLTYMGGTLCQTAGWTADGKILFANNARHWYLRFTHLYQVGLDGSAPEQLPYGLARAISFGPQGGVVLGRNTDDPARWKRYRGGTTGQLWIDENGDGSFHPLIQLGGNLTSPMWIGDRIYFLSDHEGVGNLYSCLPNGHELCRHTDHEDYYARTASSDGRRIVYHAGADLYLFDPLLGQGSPIDVDYRSPRVQRNRKFIDPSRYLTDWKLHPTGQALAAVSRGKLFSFGNWEGAATFHTLEPAGTGDFPPEVGEENEPVTPANSARYRLPRWLKDGKRILAITDLPGEEAFVIYNADGSGEPRLIKDLDIGRLDDIAVNSKKDQIAFSNHRFELLFLDLESGALKTIDRGQTGPISGFNWSPDGEWLVYSVSLSVQLTGLKLWQAATGEITPLTQPVLRDIVPAFDPQGRFIYFLSFRSFDPIYDSLQFDLSFPRGMRPYLITLRKDILSPFVPRPRLDAEEKKEDQPGEAQDKPEAGSGSEAQSTDSPEEKPAEAEKKKDEPIKIDLEGIQRRIVAFPVSEGIYGRILGARSGKVLYTRFQNETGGDNGHAKGALLVYNFEDQKEETLVSGVQDFDLSPVGEMLVFRSDNRLRVIKAGEKPGEEGGSANRKTGWINLGRMKVSVLPGAEWRQMYREAWRLQRDNFWNPDMSEVDWAAVYERYLPLVERVASRSEFSDLMWEMQGELGTSHAYEFGGDYRSEPQYAQGYLGAEFAYDAAARAWRVQAVHEGDAWDASGDSPLNEPGVEVHPGDLLVAINGQKLTRRFSPQAALVNLAGEEVILTVKPQVQESEEPELRTVTVKTLRTEAGLRYREWVEQNRQRVHGATDGRVGYLHIPDMGPAGFAEFHRGFLAEVDRAGLIVDLRFNRGGHVSSLLLEKLARRRLGYDTSRWSQAPMPFPPESVLGPMVALTNEFAGSDGDIFSHGFKMMKLGPLLGKRTWGGVIGIWPRHTLVDGTITTQPEFSFWFKDVGWGVENYGVDPDIEVDILPQDYAREVDTQLEASIAEVQRLLAENPPELPTFDNRPSRALPKLPKR